MSIHPVRVIVVDDYPLVRQGLINILKGEEGVQIVGEAADLDQCLRLCRTNKPNVVLLDTTLGDTSVVTAIRLIASQFETTRIIVVADQSERSCAVLRGARSCRSVLLGDGESGADCVVQSIRAGARGAIRLSDTTTELVNAVRTVHEGGYWVDGNATARLMESLFCHKPESLSEPLSTLTAREDLICRMIADGLSNKEIAGRLCIAQQTVKNHVSSILRKSGLEDRLQIARAVLLRPPCPSPEDAVASSTSQPVAFTPEL